MFTGVTAFETPLAGAPGVSPEPYKVVVVVFDAQSILRRDLISPRLQGCVPRLDTRAQFETAVLVVDNEFCGGGGIEARRLGVYPDNPSIVGNVDAVGNDILALKARLVNVVVIVVAEEAYPPPEARQERHLEPPRHRATNLCHIFEQPNLPPLYLVE